MRLPYIALGLFTIGLFAIGALSDGRMATADHDGLTEHNLQVSKLTDHAITRNVVLGNPIPVCSDDFPEAAQTALRWWNDGLGVSVFEWSTAQVGDCPANNAADRLDRGVGSLIIQSETTSKNCQSSTARACWSMEDKLQRDRFDATWQTWWGRMQVKVDERFTPAGVPGKARTCISHTPGTTPTGKCQGLIKTLAHELGHALSLADRYERNSAGNLECQDSNNNDLVSLMCHHNVTKDYTSIQAEDVAAYLAAYYPDAVKDVSAELSSDQSRLTIRWDIANMHVEQGVQVLWRPIGDGDAEACGTKNAAGAPADGWFHAKTIWAAASAATRPASSGPMDEHYTRVSVSLPILDPTIPLRPSTERSTVVELSGDHGLQREYAVVPITDAAPGNRGLTPRLSSIGVVALLGCGFEHMMWELRSGTLPGAGRGTMMRSIASRSSTGLYQARGGVLSLP